MAEAGGPAVAAGLGAGAGGVGARLVCEHAASARTAAATAKPRTAAVSEAVMAVSRW